MDLKGTLSRITGKKTSAERIRMLLEEDLARLVWEMNFRLLSEQGLQERILWVETAKVTQVSVLGFKERQKQILYNLRGKIRNLFYRVFGRNKKVGKEGRCIWQQ